MGCIDSLFYLNEVWRACGRLVYDLVEHLSLHLGCQHSRGFPSDRVKIRVKFSVADFFFYAQFFRVKFSVADFLLFLSFWLADFA